MNYTNTSKQEKVKYLTSGVVTILVKDKIKVITKDDKSFTRLYRKWFRL